MARFKKALYKNINDILVACNLPDYVQSYASSQGQFMLAKVHNSYYVLLIY